MGKSNKTKKKNGLKQNYYHDTVEKERHQRMFDAIINETGDVKKKKKNYFLHPDDADAEVPQVVVKSMDDLRSDVLVRHNIEKLDKGEKSVQNQRNIIIQK